MKFTNCITSPKQSFSISCSVLKLYLRNIHALFSGAKEFFEQKERLVEL